MDTNNNLKIEAVDERTRNKNYSFDVAILKMMATFFITWFHFKSLAPTSLQPIFIGGTIGNSLFFFASGYLLKFKSENYVGQWWVKKILRIMPTIWIMYLLISCFDYFRDRVSLTWYNWIYPTTYWFVNAILCFFIIIYLFRSLLKNRIYIIGLGVAAFLLNVLNYYLFVKADEIVMDGGGIKIWFYMFCFFLWGIYEKNYGKTMTPNNLVWITLVSLKII